jgi:hypothetical protein
MPRPGTSAASRRSWPRPCGGRSSHRRSRHHGPAAISVTQHGHMAWSSDLACANSLRNRNSTADTRFLESRRNDLHNDQDYVAPRDLYASQWKVT